MISLLPMLYNVYFFSWIHLYVIRNRDKFKILKALFIRFRYSILNTTLISKWINNHKPSATVNLLLQNKLESQFITARHRTFNSYQWNRYLSPLNDQYRSFLRDIKPLKDVWLNVECTVLSLYFFLLRGFLCALCLKWSLFCLSNLSITSLLFSPLS